MLENVPKVYDSVTGGLLSKPLYEADVVIDAFNDHINRERDGSFAEGFAAAREQAAGILDKEDYRGPVPLPFLRELAERIRSMPND